MRDLQKDLEICNKATPGPWEQDRCNVSAQGYTLFITYVSGKNDAQFIAAAREGWPYAIERAIKAEAEVERLKEELDKLKRFYDKVCEGHYDEVAKLQSENGKLRKVVEAAREFISSTGCNPKECGKCDPKYIGFCRWSGIGQALAELDKEES